MSFSPLRIIESNVVFLPVAHIDTDRIIPARFLKAVDTEGFGKNLFHDWRYRSDGSPDPGFVLNQPGGTGEILLTGKNFGCGSSREHAAWALYQYGFRVIISSGFADIFRNNALNNGLLPVEVNEDQLAALMEIRTSQPDAVWTVDLPRQILHTVPGSTSFRFDVNPFRKECLLSGSDLVDYLAGMRQKIAEFETLHPTK
jgi:3-isopropylmalate/(R)-2-methylmalate dehydratase small subunit